MCGIVGYVGQNEAAPLLLHGLAKLEYRGYDSAGIAVRDESTGNIQIIKAKGTSACVVGEDRWRQFCGRHLRYRTYALGDARGAV